MEGLQEKYQIKYKGRKGRKKLKEISSAIDQINREMGNLYDQSEDFQLVSSCLQDPEVKLYFMKYLKDLDAMWHGVQTYGLLRLAGKWIRKYEAEELTQPDVDYMLESLLPSKDWNQLIEPVQEEDQNGIHTEDR